MVSIYCAGPVDNSPDRTYYDIIYDMLPASVPATLFCPGRAFKTNGKVQPDYIVAVNKEAMLSADIVIFYVTDIYTCGVWCEAMILYYENFVNRSRKNNKKYVLYADPSVRIGVYMRWIANILGADWVCTHKHLEDNIKSTIHDIYMGV